MRPEILRRDVVLCRDREALPSAETSRQHQSVHFRHRDRAAVAVWIWKYYKSSAWLQLCSCRSAGEVIWHARVVLTTREISSREASETSGSDHFVPNRLR
jgi:transposase